MPWGAEQCEDALVNIIIAALARATAASGALETFCEEGATLTKHQSFRHPKIMMQGQFGELLQGFLPLIVLW